MCGAKKKKIAIKYHKENPKLKETKKKKWLEGYFSLLCERQIRWKMYNWINKSHKYNFVSCLYYLELHLCGTKENALPILFWK